MKAGKDIQFSASKGICSIKMPACGSAYVPKVNMRRPGNILLGLFLIFLISLFIGLTFAEDHQHHYGNVEVVVNVASLNPGDLTHLRKNQFIVNGGGPLHRNFSVKAKTDDDGSQTLNTLHEGSIYHNNHDGIRYGRRESSEVMRDFKRAPLPLDQARAILDSVPSVKARDEAMANLLNDWQEKFPTMTNNQNLGMFKFLIDHVNTRKPRSDAYQYMITLEIVTLARSKRQTMQDVCKDLKERALYANEDKKKNLVAGWKLISESEVCLFGRLCTKGTYPNLAGCQSGVGVTEEISLDYHISDENFNGDQNPFPVNDLSNICQLGDIQLKHCSRTHEKMEKIVIYKSQGQSNFWIGDSSVNVTPLYSSLKDFNCSGEASKQCNGDEIFKKTYLEAGSDPSCYCEGASNRSIVHLTLGSQTFRVDMVLFDQIKILYNRGEEEDFICVGCEISCNKGEVIIDYSHPVEMIEMCQGRFCLDLKPSKVFTIPLSLAAIGYSFTYYVRFENDKEMVGSLQCKVEDMCPLIDCHLCYEKLKNPQCYNFVDKANFITLLLVWFLLLAIIVKAAKLGYFGIVLIKNLFKILFKIGFWILKAICGFMGTQVLRVTEITTKAEEQWDGTIKTVEFKEKKIQFKPRPTYIKSIVLLALFLPFISCCTDTKTLTSSQLSCIMVSNEMVCNTQQSVSISVSPVGQMSCFIMKALDGRILGSLTVETSSLDLRCNEKDLYYTFPATAGFDQKCYCTASSSGWGSDESCDNYNKGKKCAPPLACSASILKTSGCETAQGGWEQSCFSYGSQYCYYRVSFENRQKKVFKVSSCSSFYWEAKVIVKIQTLNNTETIKASLNAGSKVTFSGGDLQLISASVPPMPILSSCFLREGKVTYLGDCIKSGGITAGRVGEIQCDSSTAAMKPTNSHCSFARGIWNVYAQGGRLALKTNLYDYKAMKTRLPVKSGGYMIKDEGGIRASLNYIALMSLRLNLKDMKLQPYSLETQCSAKMVTVKGCVSCLSGAILTLKAKSIGSATKAILNCPSLKAEVPFALKPADEIIKLNVHFEVGKINEKCYIICPGNKVTIDLKADLISDIVVTRSLEDHLSDYTEVFSNWVKDIFGQFDTFLIFAICGVVVVGSLIILKLFLSGPSRLSHFKRY